MWWSSSPGSLTRSVTRPTSRCSDSPTDHDGQRNLLLKETTTAHPLRTSPVARRSVRRPMTWCSTPGAGESVLGPPARPSGHNPPDPRRRPPRAGTTQGQTPAGEPPAAPSRSDAADVLLCFWCLVAIIGVWFLPSMMMLCSPRARRPRRSVHLGSTLSTSASAVTSPTSRSVATTVCGGLRLALWPSRS